MSLKIRSELLTKCITDTTSLQKTAFSQGPKLDQLGFLLPSSSKEYVSMIAGVSRQTASSE